MDPRKTPSKESHKIIKNPSIPPRPVIIYTLPQKIIRVEDPADFLPLVQRLTGKTPSPSPSLSPPQTGSLSPASQYAAMERANRKIQRETPSGVLSPEPSFLPSFTPDFFLPFPTTDHSQDGYWNQQRQYQPPLSSIPHGGPQKRTRSEFGHDMHSYLSGDDDRGIPHSIKDSRTIGSAYDQYLQRVVTQPMPSEEAGPYNSFDMGGTLGRNNNMMPSSSMSDLMTGRGGILPLDIGPNDRGIGFGQQDIIGRLPQEELVRLPQDASNTLFVEGLPSDCSMREVAHIFRPFLGYREVRLVNKDTKQQRNGDPVVLCFVDFEDPACAATALSALQGYQMDEFEPDSKILRLQFSRNRGPRPGQRGGIR